MIRIDKILLCSALAIVLAACGTPRGPAPVEYRGAGVSTSAPAAPTNDLVPDAAPLEPVETQELPPEPLAPPEPVSQPQAFDAQKAALQAQNDAATAAPTGQDIISTRTRPAQIKVQKGDTLFSLSEKYQIALKPLIRENNLKEPYALRVGQTLELPPPLHYRVRKGDTLYSVSRHFAIDYRSLALINGIDEPYAINPDDMLVLPALAHAQSGGWKAANPRPTASSSPSKGGAAPAKAPNRPKAPSKTSTFAWPVKGKILSGFGAKPGGTRNDGINIAAANGTPVRAAGAGTVVYAGAELKSFGNLILLRHPNGWVSAYAHNRRLLVKEGANVKAGDTIAEVGSTGSVDVPQLHFETRRGRQPVDPRKYLPAL